MTGRRPEVDLAARRYYIYRLSDADGGCVYVGRSCQPLTRLREHHRTTDWAASVVQIETWGPLTWREACEAERTMVYASKPTANRMYVHTHTYKEPRLA